MKKKWGWKMISVLTNVELWVGRRAFRGADGDFSPFSRYLLHSTCRYGPISRLRARQGGL